MVSQVSLDVRRPAYTCKQQEMIAAADHPHDCSLSIIMSIHSHRPNGSTTNSALDALHVQNPPALEDAETLVVGSEVMPPSTDTMCLINSALGALPVQNLLALEDAETLVVGSEVMPPSTDTMCFVHHHSAQQPFGGQAIKQPQQVVALSDLLRGDEEDGNGPVAMGG